MSGNIHTYIDRGISTTLRESIERVPVTALLGPRQCGKSTLARRLVSDLPEALFLDLERPSDLRKLAEPEWFLSRQAGKLVVLDEIHWSRPSWSVCCSRWSPIWQND